jgi:hypothetical protein
VTITFEDILADARGLVVTTEAGEGIIVDWRESSSKPESFVEMKFGRRWVRVECDVQSVIARLGRDLTVEAVEAGTCTIRLDNSSGRFTDWQGQQPPINETTEVRVRVRYPSQRFGEQIVWWGFVSEFEQEWTRVSDTVVVKAVDMVALLAEQGGSLGWTAGSLGDTVSRRLEHLLSRIGLSSRRIYCEPGQVRLINPTLTSQTVIDEAQIVALSDGGRFFVECDTDGTYFVYLSRSRFTRQPGDIEGRYILSTASSVDRSIEPEQVRVGAIRPGQPSVPLFSDLCGATSIEAYPYTDLGWKYRAWEVPSIVAVSNIEPPDKRDLDGNPLPKPWTQVGDLAGGQGRRHNIIEYTDLEFSTEDEATDLAHTYAAALSRSAIDVTKLQVHPELDERLWDVVAGLRQGDWVAIERNLITDRITATCAIEGIEWELTPPPSGGEPRWKVTYRLSAIEARAEAQSPDVRPPRPPTVGEPLPEVLPVITLSEFEDGSSFVERGQIPSLFTLEITDGGRVEHFAFARNDDIGTVQLPSLAPGSYSGDTVIRTFGGIPLDPGVWRVWVRDRDTLTRTSNQIAVVIPDWVAPAIVSVDWNMLGTSTVTYTDDRYPPKQPIFTGNARGGVRKVEVTDWRDIGGGRFELDVNTGALPPGEWQFWVQDAYIPNRKSVAVPYYKAAVAPTGLRLGSFSPASSWDAATWRSVPVVCNPVPEATGYVFEIVVNGETSEKRPTGPGISLTGGETSSSGGQTSRRCNVRVRSVVNGEESPWSQEIIIDTGFPYWIERVPFILDGGAVPVTGREQVAGLLVPGTPTPAGSQSVDPNADRFVGVKIDELVYSNLQATVQYGGFIPTKLDHYGDGLTSLRWVMGTATANRPGASPAVPSPVAGQLITQNPQTPTELTVRVNVVLGQAGQWVGLRCEGEKWTTTAPAIPDPLSGLCWISADRVRAEGTIYVWREPRNPVQIA